MYQSRAKVVPPNLTDINEVHQYIDSAESEAMNTLY